MPTAFIVYGTTCARTPRMSHVMLCLPHRMSCGVFFNSANEDVVQLLEQEKQSASLHSQGRKLLLKLGLTQWIEP